MSDKSRRWMNSKKEQNVIEGIEGCGCTSEDVKDRLRDRFSDRRKYAVATEVGDTTGFQRRRLDMVVCDCYASDGFAIEGIEIKISREDFKREIRDSSKHNIFFQWIDFYSLACPYWVVDMELIPKHWGLYVVEKNGTLRCRRKPSMLHDVRQPDLDRGFAAALLRAMCCQSNSRKEIDESYAKGLEHGRDLERKYHETRAFHDDNARKARCFDEMLEALQVVDEWDIDYAARAIKYFKAMNPYSMVKQMEDASKLLTNLAGACKALDTETK